MSNLKRAWMGERYVPDKAALSLTKYLQGVAGSLICYEDFVFDRHSMGTLVNLKFCGHCLRYQAEDCCTGNPAPMTNEQRRRTESILPEAIMLTDSMRQDAFNTYGGITPKGSISTRGSPHDSCMMSCQSGDGTSCAIHAWCQSHGKDPLEYKPYTCSLFPLDGIIMPSGKTFVFCACSETSGFTSWFYTQQVKICVNYENLHKALARDTGGSKYLRSLNIDNIIQDNIADGYNPVYIEQERVLRYFIGNNAYEYLVKEMERG